MVFWKSNSLNTICNCHSKNDIDSTIKVLNYVIQDRKILKFLKDEFIIFVGQNDLYREIKNIRGRYRDDSDVLIKGIDSLAINRDTSELCIWLTDKNQKKPSDSNQKRDKKDERKFRIDDPEVIGYLDNPKDFQNTKHLLIGPLSFLIEKGKVRISKGKLSIDSILISTLFIEDSIYCTFYGGRIFKLMTGDSVFSIIDCLQPYNFPHFNSIKNVDFTSDSLPDSTQKEIDREIEKLRLQLEEAEQNDLSNEKK